MSRRRRRSRSSSRRCWRCRSSYDGGDGERRPEREFERKGEGEGDGEYEREGEGKREYGRERGGEGDRDGDRGRSCLEVLMCTSIEGERGRRAASWMIGL